MQGQDLIRALVDDAGMDTAATVAGKRGRPPAGVVELLDGPTFSQDKRRKRDA